MIVADIGAMLWKGSGSWTRIDDATAAIAGVGIIATLILARLRGVPATDPVAKGIFAIFFKAVPQLALAVSIALAGGAGLAGMAILTGHITILTRLGQLWFSLREAGWDRNRVGSAISELANEGSWLVVTIVWLLC